MQRAATLLSSPSTANEEGASLGKVTTDNNKNLPTPRQATSNTCFSHSNFSIYVTYFATLTSTLSATQLLVAFSFRFVYFFWALINFRRLLNCQRTCFHWRTKLLLQQTAKLSTPCQHAHCDNDCHVVRWAFALSLTQLYTQPTWSIIINFAIEHVQVWCLFIT